MGRAPSALSLLENVLREPKLSLIEQLARARSVPVSDLLQQAAAEPPGPAGDRARRRPAGPLLPSPRPSAAQGQRAGRPPTCSSTWSRWPRACRPQQSKPTASPEEARAANAALRDAMRERDNYFEVIEQEAGAALSAGGYSGGALSQGMLVSVVSLARLRDPLCPGPAPVGAVADRPA